MHARTDTVPDCNSLQKIPLTDGFLLEAPAHHMKELKKPAMTSQRYYRGFFVRTHSHTHTSQLTCIPYSWKYWWELNLVVGPKIAIAKNFFGGFKFGGWVWDCHMYIIRKYEILIGVNLAVTKVDCQTTTFTCNSQPNFPAIQYN